MILMLGKFGKVRSLKDETYLRLKLEEAGKGNLPETGERRRLGNDSNSLKEGSVGGFGSWGLSAPGEPVVESGEGRG
jgi:hypothetical protein